MMIKNIWQTQIEKQTEKHIHTEKKGSKYVA